MHAVRINVQKAEIDLAVLLGCTSHSPSFNFLPWHYPHDHPTSGKRVATLLATTPILPSQQNPRSLHLTASTPWNSTSSYTIYSDEFTPLPITPQRKQPSLRSDPKHQL